jgi:hypothetical protein
MDRVFNDDLLMNQGDLEYARAQFPEVVHLLDNGTLRSTFKEYEAAANTARSKVRRLGIVAVGCATIALLSAATAPLRHGVPYNRAISAFLECFALAAAAIAAGSLWLGPWRKTWAEARFMTERLRQWHFQLIVQRPAEIEASLQATNGAAKATFEQKRDQWLKEYLHESEGKLDSRMAAFANDPDFASDWLHEQSGSYEAGMPVTKVFEAYRKLRFDHQYDYATYKLSDAKDKPFWEFLQWPSLRQEVAIGGGVSFCFVAAMIGVAAVVVANALNIWPPAVMYLESLILVLAVIGIALRTVEEGLGVTKDIERYRDYRGKVRRLLLTFEKTTDVAERLQLMREMELAAVDELRGFLRTHCDAAFVL